MSFLKTLISTCFIVLMGFVFSQKVYFEPNFIDPCKDSSRVYKKLMVDTLEWNIYNKNGIRVEKSGKGVLLDSNQEYLMTSNMIWDSARVYTDAEKFSNEFYLPTLEFTPINFDSMLYTFCKAPAEGLIIDYFSKNQIRKKGTFKNGELMDSLIVYDPSGRINTITYDNNNRYIRKVFMNNGDLLVDIDTDKRFNYEYFSGGKLRSKSSNRSDRSWAYNYNGDVYKKSNRRHLKYYQDNKKLSYEAEYKELYFWDRFKKSEKVEQWINELKFYDSTGVLMRKYIIYNDFRYNFQWLSKASYHHIKPWEYASIDYYQNGNRFKGFNLLYFEEEEKWDIIMFNYDKEGNFLSISNIDFDEFIYYFKILEQQYK